MKAKIFDVGRSGICGLGAPSQPPLNKRGRLSATS